MIRPTPAWRALVLCLALSALPVGWLQIVRLAAAAPFSWSGLAACWGAAGGLLLVSRWMLPHTEVGTTFVWPWASLAALGTAAVAALVYIVGGATWAAWVVLALLYLLLLGLERGLTKGAGTAWRWAMRGLLVLLGGAIPVAIGQLESRFSEEEFFVALQVLAMAIFWALLLVAQHILARNEPAPGWTGFRLDRRWTALSLFLLTVVGLGVMVRTYQHSFYPSEAPAFEGISAETPFLCGKVSPDPHTYDGEEVFQRLLARVAANPNAGAPEYGMLALGTGEQQWAESFREALLSEAAEGAFAGPAHSVKWSQYAASLRVYYAPRVYAAFPDLFSADEWARLQTWFADINHRAQTVELVDWMYALAFAKWPEGPYENQENGAGLLALLEAEGLAAPELSAVNQDYLARNPRGWMARLRNTDDAFIYQPEWLNNSYFQELHTTQALQANVLKSFEWLLLQTLPNGAPIRYNHPARPSQAGTAYLGARLTLDPRYVWLAARQLEYAEAESIYLSAQPGAEQPVALTGYSPNQGSCLLYGDSGLPNQVGPVAPDKIVMRDGWSNNASYLLLNLRFTGWHRYKATNTVSMLYQNAEIVTDVLEGESFSWLPTGRSAFRDKRIPRENLNGLLIERSGMSKVLNGLTGIGGPWAQDPPYYAEVLAFETGEDFDSSHTRMTDWRGWQHDRYIYFYHDGGPIVVVDTAEGPAQDKAALAWHLPSGGMVEGQRDRLQAGERPVEVLLLAPGEDTTSSVVSSGMDGGQSQDVLYLAPKGGQLKVMTIFLLSDWVGAEVKVDGGERTLRIARRDAEITLPEPFGE